MLWMVFWFISPIKVINLFTGRYVDGLLFANCNFLCNAALWIEWNSHKFVADGPGTCPVRSMSGISGLKMVIFGSVRDGENFIKIFCNRDKKK